jgi:hypothetical protein
MKPRSIRCRPAPFCKATAPCAATWRLDAKTIILLHSQHLTCQSRWASVKNWCFVRSDVGVV